MAGQQDYHTITPYLTAQGASEAIEFYKRVFGATESMRFTEDGRIGHAEIVIGDSPLMISDEYPEIDVLSPRSVGGTPVVIHLFVDDVDAVVERAVAAGVKLLRPVADQFFGVRNGIIQDPFGHRWMIATQTEEMSRAEIHKHFDAQ